MYYKKYFYFFLFSLLIFTHNIFHMELVYELPKDILNFILIEILEAPDVSEDARLNWLNTFNCLSKKHNTVVRNYIQNFKLKNNIINDNYTFAKFKHDFLIKNVDKSAQYIFKVLRKKLSSDYFPITLSSYKNIILQKIQDILLSDPTCLIKEYGKEQYIDEISPLVFEIIDLKTAGHPYACSFKKLEVERIMNEL